MKKKSSSVYLLLIAFCILVGCQNPQDVKSVKITYLPEFLETMNAIEDVDEMFRYFSILNDTIIRSKDFIQSFDLETKTLVALDSINAIDLRIWCHVEKRNGEEHNLYLGAHFGTIYDGVRMYDNARLLKLVKDKIYKN